MSHNDSILNILGIKDKNIKIISVEEAECQHRFKIVRNHRFKNVLFHRFKCCFVCCSV